MRTFGRILSDPMNPDSAKIWVQVTTTDNGNNDAVMITTLVQNLKLILGESPFYADRGIPAQQSVLQQVFPDFYVWTTQTRFVGFFASLIVAKIPSTNPEYTINLVTNSGARLAVRIPV